MKVRSVPTPFSPLLANIALDGLQELLFDFKETITYKTLRKGKLVKVNRKIDTFDYLRYADDFVVFSHRKEWLEEVLPIIRDWLRERGLELNEEKTRIRNIREKGFTFLGFNIRQHKSNTLRWNSNRYHREVRKRSSTGRKYPRAKEKQEEVYSVIITPGKKETTEFLREIRGFIKRNGSAMSWENLIKKLNPKIRGWGMYYKYVVSKRTFSKVREEVLNTLLRMLKRKHPEKSTKWLKEKYYTTVDEDQWVPYTVYTDRTGKQNKLHLINIAKDIPIKRFVKVTGANSPLDPELTDYWRKRNLSLGKERFAQGSKYEIIFKKQKGICPLCGEHISLDDEFELHHILPIKDGGTNKIKNLVFLHRRCHKSKHKELHY